MTYQRKILLTGAGAPGGVGIIKELVRAGHFVVGTDINPFASGREFCHDYFVNKGPRNFDFLDDMCSAATERSIELLVPLVTLELDLFAENKRRFESSGIKVLVNDYESLFTINDKGKLYQKFADTEFIPKYQIAKNPSELFDAISEFIITDSVCVIKPCVSNGSRGVRIVRRDYDPFDSLLYSKPGDLQIGHEQILQIFNGKDIPDYIVSEYMPGSEYTCDVVFNDGAVELALVRKRIEMRLGISTAGEFIDNAPFIKHITYIGRKLNLSGPVGFQFKESAQGDMKLLEINPRFQGTSVSARGLGINYPDFVIRNEFGDPQDILPDVLSGVKFSRFYDEVFYK